MARFSRSLAALFVVALAVFFSVATSTLPPEGTCEGLVDDGAEPGETCEVKEDCNEVCCLCEGTADVGFAAQGCDIDQGVCMGGDALCSAALAQDPSLCPEG